MSKESMQQLRSTRPSKFIDADKDGLLVSWKLLVSGIATLLIVGATYSEVRGSLVTESYFTNMTEKMREDTQAQFGVMDGRVDGLKVKIESNGKTITQVNDKMDDATAASAATTITSHILNPDVRLRKYRTAYKTARRNLKDGHDVFEGL